MEMDALRAPSLAGIISDPLGAGKRVVPATARADGRWVCTKVK